MSRRYSLSLFLSMLSSSSSLNIEVKVAVWVGEVFGLLALSVSCSVGVALEEDSVVEVLMDWVDCGSLRQKLNTKGG